MMELLSERGRSNVKDLPSLVQAHFDALGDMYDPTNNPGGHINMGTAETRLVDKEAIQLLEQTTAKMKLTPHNIHYDHFHGSQEFRTAIAEHWQDIFFRENPSRRLTKDNIAVCAGCTVALEMFATMLCDPGDVILIPAPYYSGFTDDIHDRAEAIPVGVHCGIDLPKAAFETALLEQKQLGRRVRAVLFSSPNNPVGTVYSPEAVMNLIQFCMENDLDLISDEIYAETVFDPDSNWISTLSLVPDEYRHRVHGTSSFAKDFALSGFRTGFAVSYNPDIIKGMETITYYSCVSSHTQALLTALIKMPELPEFMAQSRQRLKTAKETMAEGLGKLGIKTLPAQAGIFLFADFRSYMANLEFQEEHVLWRRIYEKLKINISPGQFFDAEEPGWFRLCYAHDPATVDEALRRLATL